MTQRRLLLTATLASLAALFTACGKSAAPTPPAAATATAASSPATAQVYKVATDAVYAPFESLNERGEIVGFDIDVARAVAERAGLQVRFVNTPWEGMFNTVAQGDSDILVSAITITDERRQTVDFTAPYFDARQLIAVRGDSTVTRFTDLKALRVAVQTGTTGDEAVTKLLGKTNDKLRRFESTPLALAELESGGVDAVVADNGVVTHYLAQHPGSRFKAVEDPSFVAEQYGLVVKKGRADLLAQLNQGLAAIRADGTLARIQARYFGPADAKP
ncbi:MAG TPA: basic amino acid ABC transporter substrate-binding protein [Burkholderiaceae bacterium]|nr:basic amino acid ABC transporter substrate-binding protein [Burkholderiaceae bacterium]